MSDVANALFSFTTLDNFQATMPVATAVAPATRGEDATVRNEQDQSDWVLRRWEAGETSRLNRAHWAKAHGQQINADLAGNLRTLRARCCYEAANNPIVEGLIFTHAVDIVGTQFPRLQIVSDSEAFNQAAEQLVMDWFKMPDINGQMSGVDVLQQCVKLWWTKGEHLLQKVSQPEAGLGEISLRILAIDPDRLDTDPAFAGDANVALGVRRNRNGRPIAYQIAQPDYFGPFMVANTTYEEFPAEDVIHQFEITEPGQVRGFPWLASCLSVIADIRDYDMQVLDAARLAASQGIVWYADNDAVEFREVDATIPMERNVQSTGPVGYKPMMIDPKQPADRYVDFRTERLRELGRSRSIPLMKILLGSERHNFASARMDNQNYARAVSAIQGWTERQTLNPLVAAVLQEARLLQSGGRFVLPPMPSRIQFHWSWTKQPHVDPKKEADAQAVKIRNGTISVEMACNDDGNDFDAVVASRKRTNDLLKKAGLPEVAYEVPVTISGGAAPQPNQDDNAEAADEVLA
jgi:lambda family phage portal protein